MNIPGAKELEDLCIETVCDARFQGSYTLRIDAVCLETIAAKLQAYAASPWAREPGEPLSVVRRNRLAELMTTAVLSVIATPPLATSTELFVERLVERMAELNGFTLSLSSADCSVLYGIAQPDPESDATVGFLRDWFAEALAKGGSASAPSLPQRADIDSSTRPALNGFVGAPLTEQDDDSLLQLESLSNAVAEVFSEYGCNIETYQPIQHTNPKRDPVASFDPVFVHLIDTTRLSVSDVVVGLVRGPSSGLGVAMAYAERFQAVMLLLVAGEAGRSPLLVGLNCRKAVEQVNFSGDVRPFVRRFLTQNLEALEDHRRLRENRVKYFQPSLEKARSALVSEGRAVVAQRLPKCMVMSRVNEILQSVDFYATQTLEEDRALRSALRMESRRRPPTTGVAPGVQLTVPELEALADYAGLRHLSAEAVIALQVRAIRARARSGPKRLRFSSPRDWEAFDDERGS